MKTSKQTHGNNLKIQTTAISLIKIALLGVVFSLISLPILAQTFVEDTGNSFSETSTGTVAFADIDNDGDQDVIIGTKLYTNDGNGSFEFEMDAIAPTSNNGGATSCAFADIDNDKDQDFFISWGLGSQSCMQTNNGSGSFTVSYPLQTRPYGQHAFADVDNDNDQDVLITGYTNWYGWNWYIGEDPRTILYLNDGAGNFTPNEIPMEGVAFSAVVFADTDNDNDQDVLIAGLNKDWIPITKLYTNNGGGFFTESTETDFEGTYSGYMSRSQSFVAFADVDNDGDQDVLITGENNEGAYIAKLYSNYGNGHFKVVTGTPFEGVYRSAVAFSDVDNDNDQDVLITGIKQNAQKIAKLYINDGTGVFSEVPDNPFAAVGNSSVAFADVDNDNDQDVIINGVDASGQIIAKLYRNISSELNTEANSYKSILSEYKAPETIIDFRGVSIYPNPSHGQITVDIKELSDVTINIYSLNGSRIYHKENIKGPQYQFELNVDAGIYILEVSSQQVTQRHKLVKE